MMATHSQVSPVTYEELAALEIEFDHVETEIIRQQVCLTRPLYEKRERLISQIPNFWPLVIEQAPPDIDEYIQPSDSALLLSSLKSLTVTHFEVENGRRGDPRSVAIRWEFAENEYFDDSVLEKKFWHRRSTDGWAGLVSEPVDIKWKEGKDLTGGLLRMVKSVWDEEQRFGAKSDMERYTNEQQALKEKIENTGLGGLSFFAWFGFRGKAVSAEESKLATEKETERQKVLQDGRRDAASVEDPDDEDKDLEKDEGGDGLEIFPDGGSLAVTIAEDLWPGAIKYFTQAQEQDAQSENDFESDEDINDGLQEGKEDGRSDRPAKKVKV